MSTHKRSAAGKSLLDLFNRTPVAIAVLAVFILGFGFLVAQAALTLTGAGVTADGAVQITAGGTNQDVTLAPSGSGSGSVVLSGDAEVTGMLTLSGGCTGCGGGGGGTPGGADTQVQFNNAGAFGGDANLTFTSGTGTLFVGTSLAVGTSTLPASSTAVIAAPTPQLDLKKTTTSKDSWGLSNNNNLNFKYNNVTQHSFSSDGNVVFGSSTIPSGSRVFIHGGSNGANVDARGIAAPFQDQATFEAQGSDYDTNPKSIKIQYYGASNFGGTTAGYPNVDLGVLSWGNPTTAIVEVSNAAPLHFFVDGNQIMDVTSTGLIVGTSTTPDANFQVLRDTDSTIYIGDATHSGCLVMGDSDNGGLSYITVLDGALTASAVKPDICQ